MSHMGYILLVLAMGTEVSLIMAFYYLFIYLVMTFLTFASILVIRRVHDFTSVERISELLILKNANPLFAIFVTFILFSMAGFPPLAGFLIKFFAFEHIVASGSYIIFVVLFVLVCVSAVYYVRVVQYLNFTGKSSYISLKPFSVSTSVLFIMLVLVLLGLQFSKIIF